MASNLILLIRQHFTPHCQFELARSLFEKFGPVKLISMAEGTSIFKAVLENSFEVESLGEKELKKVLVVLDTLIPNDFFAKTFAELPNSGSLVHSSFLQRNHWCLLSGRGPLQIFPETQGSPFDDFTHYRHQPWIRTNEWQLQQKWQGLLNLNLDQNFKTKLLEQDFKYGLIHDNIFHKTNLNKSPLKFRMQSKSLVYKFPSINDITIRESAEFQNRLQEYYTQSREFVSKKEPKVRKEDRLLSKTPKGYATYYFEKLKKRLRRHMPTNRWYGRLLWLSIWKASSLLRTYYSCLRKLVKAGS